MARATQQILLDSTIAEKLSRNALEWSRGFTWDKTAIGFHEFLVEVIAAFHSPS
jgi:hypothetical protein